MTEQKHITLNEFQIQIKSTATNIHHTAAYSSDWQYIEPWRFWGSIIQSSPKLRYIEIWAHV